MVRDDGGAHPEPVRVPIAGRARDSVWYLSNHETPDEVFSIEIVLDREAEELVINDPVSAFYYLLNHCLEHDLLEE